MTKVFNAEEFRKSNDFDRMKFVELWAAYVRTHADIMWSKQQNVLINSIFQNGKKPMITREQYLKIKGEKFK